MKSRFRFVIAVAALVGSGLTHAVPVTETTSVYLTFRDCVPGATKCDGITATQQFEVDGLPGATSASDTMTGQGTRSVSASVSIGPDGTASHSATAVSLGETATSPATRDSTNSYSLQKYTYNGAGPAQLSFYGVLDYSIDAPAENATFPVGPGTSTTALAQLVAFTTTDAIDPGNTELDNFFYLAGADFQFLPTFNILGVDTVQSPPQLSGADQLKLSVSLSLNAGDTVWLYTAMQTPSVNGAVVNATLTTAVPAPATLLLLGLGLVGFAGAAGRRARA